jgi:L-threonylcarbamoyladenylate synthase
MNDWLLNPRLHHTARVIHLGGVVAYPTEAVWGLGCNPFDAEAVEHLLVLKQRPVSKGLILIAANIEQLEPFIDHLDDLQIQRMKNSWPGPFTWLVPNNQRAPSWITGDFNSLALRVTDHPVAASLCKAYGGVIVSTSANVQGQPPARSRLDLRRHFGNSLNAISPGEVGKRTNPSEIRDLLTGQIVRPS